MPVVRGGVRVEADRRRRGGGRVVGWGGGKSRVVVMSSARGARDMRKETPSAMSQCLIVRSWLPFGSAHFSSPPPAPSSQLELEMKVEFRVRVRSEPAPKTAAAR